MIEAHALHRLLDSIARSILGAADLVADARELDADDHEDQRSALVAFAHQHELDLQDLATLVRVAAGEASFSPVIEWKVAPL